MKRRSAQAGYSLLMVVFLVATMLIVATMVTPNLLTEGRREREAETIWRGEQYERAIGMYFRKFGKYPTKIDDLTKQTNGVRFLRQAYTDPMNKEDGSWRFIYVGPNGQLIGSLRHASLLQGALPTPTTTGTSGTGLGAIPGPGQGIGLQPSGPSGTSPAAGTSTGPIGSGTQPQPGTPGAGQPGQQTDSALSANPLESQPQPLTGDVIGGNIIGVASKIKQSSIRDYLGGDTYQLWEFIWNPNQQGALPAQNSANPVPSNGQTTAPTSQTPQVPAVNAPATTPPPTQ